MRDEQKYANIVDMVGDFNNDKNLILQLTQQIADLEAKLAESERSNEINIKERDKICVDLCAEYNKQIIDLKIKLEEAQKTIEI